MELARKDCIDVLEEAMLASPHALAASQVDVRHYLTNSGVYAREMIMPAGLTVTGKAKKEDYISVLSAGFVTERTAAGIRHYRAPCIIVSEPGIKRALFAHELSVLATVHHTEQTELAKIEEDILVPINSKQLEFPLEELWPL